MRSKFVAYDYSRKDRKSQWVVHLATRIEISTGGQGLANGKFSMYALCSAYGEADAIEFDEASPPPGVETETCAECVAKAKELSAS